MLFSFSDLHVILPLHYDHQSTLIFKHIRYYTPVNASTQVSYLPCVYIALASSSKVKLKIERRAWNFAHIPTSTQDTRNAIPLKSYHENIKSILLMHWASVTHWALQQAGQFYCMYKTEELTFENQKCFLYLKRTRYSFTYNLWDSLSSDCGHTPATKCWTFGSLSIYLTGIAYRMVQNSKETCWICVTESKSILAGTELCT